MKISALTLAYLRSFSKINPGIVFKPGNVIKVRDKSASQFHAAVDVEETFPTEFAIDDMQKFLGLVSLFDDPDFDFQKDRVNVTDLSGKKLSYRYADPDLIVQPKYDKVLKLPSLDAEFTFSKEQQDSITKGLASLRAPQIAFIGDGRTIKASTYNVDKPLMNSFTIDVGSTDKIFTAVVNAEFLEMIPQSYEVAISFVGMIRFASQPTYWMPLNNKSKFE